jgi:hypothetical protein
MWNAKFIKSTNNAKRPEHERLNMLSVPTCNKIPLTTSLHLLLFSVRYTLVFSTMPSFTPPLQMLSNVLFSLENETRSLAGEAYNVQQPHSLLSAGYCWLVALTLRNQTRQVSAIQADGAQILDDLWLRWGALLFCVAAQPVSGVVYRRFRTVYQSHLQGSSCTATHLPTRAA